MPIKRFLHQLERDGELETYMELLASSYNPGAVSGLMCKELVSIGYDGDVFDCDFNQQLEMEMEFPDKKLRHVRDFKLDDWLQHDIRTERHCYGCTAGAGSGCGGAIERWKERRVLRGATS